MHCESVNAVSTSISNDELNPCATVPCKNYVRVSTVKEGAPVFSDGLRDVWLKCSPQNQTMVAEDKV